MMYFQLLVSAVLALLLVFSIIKGYRAFKFGLVIAVLPSVIFIYTYIFKQRTYLIRDALKDMKTYAKDEYITGDYSYYYQFYSNARPFYNIYNLKYNHPKEIDFICDSLFLENKKEIRIEKSLPSENTYSLVLGDTVHQAKKKYIVLNKYILSDYDYLVLKRVK